MTKIVSEEFQCVKCQHKFSATLNDSINVSLSPQLKAAFLNDEINKAVCPNCNQGYSINREVLYHDMDNNIMIWVLPREFVPQKEAFIQKYTESMRENVLNLPGLFDRYHFDIVFGIEELKESLNDMEQNYSDKIVSITKNVYKNDRAGGSEDQFASRQGIKNWFRKFLP